MQKILIRKTLPRSQGAFTLIEILVVMVLIAIITSVVMLTVTSSNRQLENEATRLHHVLRLASQEAVLQYQQFGIHVDEVGYQFLVLDEETNKWQRLQSVGTNFLKDYDMPEGIKLDIKVEGLPGELLKPSDDEETAKEDEDEEEIPAPQIFLLSSGEVSDFEIFIEQEDNANVFRIVGKLDGTLSLFEGDEAATDK